MYSVSYTLYIVVGSLPNFNIYPAVIVLWKALYVNYQNVIIKHFISVVLQQLSLDAVWTVIFGVPASKPVVVLAKEQVDLCPEAAILILAMVRSMLNQVI